MILVTGGLGFIGAHASRALLDLGEPCVLAQRRDRPVPDFLAQEVGDRVVVEQADCTNPDSVLSIGRRHEITGIVHLAAAGLAGTPLDQLWSNTRALFAVLRAAQTWGVARVVQASTIGVYAGVSADTYREDAPLPMPSAHPIQASKKSAEILAACFAASADLDIVSVRIGAIWGPLGRTASPFFGAPQLIHAAVNPDPAGASKPPYADDAIDMCYVRDCGRAIALLQTAKALGHQTYNIGSGRATTNQEVAEAVSRVVPGAAPALAAGRGPHASAEDAHLDIGRLRGDTGFEPAYDLDHAVADYVSWLRAGHPR
jgi:UDP-glucose 4-epimerase